MYKIPANTLFIGKNVVFVPECHSTNTLASELTQNPSLLEGTVVITNHQTAGRGQRGNVWEAKAGENLTLSLVLKPVFLPVIKQFYLNIVASLAIHDLVTQHVNKEVLIKWPNDMLVEGRKICGILIENQLAGAGISCSVCGIGFNVNQSDFSNLLATSLLKETNRPFDLQMILDELMGNLEARYLQLRQGKYEQLKAEYLAKLFRRGEEHLYASEGREFKGEIIGIDEVGRLAVKVDSKIEYFEVKQIRYL